MVTCEISITLSSEKQKVDAESIVFASQKTQLPIMPLHGYPFFLTATAIVACAPIAGPL